MKATEHDGYVYCTDALIERHAPELLDFGIVDASGRAIGYRVTRSTVELLERDGSGGRICKAEDLGRWFTADAIATRDGLRFGASSGTLRARTEPELDRLIAARVAGARARYTATAGFRSR